MRESSPFLLIERAQIGNVCLVHSTTFKNSVEDFDKIKSLADAISSNQKKTLEENKDTLWCHDKNVQVKPAATNIYFTSNHKY